MKRLPESRKFRDASDGDGDVSRGERERRSRRDKRKRKSGIPGCREDICVMKYPRDTRTHRPRLFSSGAPCRNTEEKRRIPPGISRLRPSFCFTPRGNPPKSRAMSRESDYQQRGYFTLVSPETAFRFRDHAVLGG